MPLTPINHWSLVSGNIFYLLFIFKYCFILYIYTDICFRFFLGGGGCCLLSKIMTMLMIQNDGEIMFTGSYSHETQVERLRCLRQKICLMPPGSVSQGSAYKSRIHNDA